MAMSFITLFLASDSLCNFNSFIGEAQESNPSIGNRLFREVGQKDNSTTIESVERTNAGQSALTIQPPPPVYFKGYTLPPGNPCESFTLPPPPADKKRTGPRRKLKSVSYTFQTWDFKYVILLSNFLTDGLFR